MDAKKTDTRDNAIETRAAILRVLASRERKARFVTEVFAALAPLQLNKEVVERNLADLVGAGVIMVRDHFCADPHLIGVDLRIAALISDDAGAEAQMSVIRAIDGAWDKWLAEYLANHRCT
jgi:hypothetical protein